MLGAKKSHISKINNEKNSDQSGFRVQSVETIEFSLILLNKYFDVQSANTKATSIFPQI